MRFYTNKAVNFMNNFFYIRQISILAMFFAVISLSYACKNGKAEQQTNEATSSPTTAFSPDSDNFNVLLLPFHPDEECKAENLEMEQELIGLLNTSQWAKEMKIDVKLMTEEDCPYKPQVAQELGKEHNADVIVWGFYNPKKQKAEILYTWINDVIKGHTGLVQLTDLRNGFYLKDDINYIGNWLIGVAACSQDKWEEALTSFQYTTTEKCDVAITPLIGHCYYALHRQTEVDSIMKVIGNCVPEYVGLAMIGWRHQIGQKRQEAFDHYTKALEKNPKYKSAYEHRATVLFESKKFKEAIADFTNAIRLGTDEESVYSTRAIAYHNSGDREKAIEDYTRALKLNPDIAKTYYDRANAHFLLGHYDEALKDYTTGIGKEPSKTRAYLNRGITYVEIDNYEAAIEDFTHVLKEDPKNITALAYRGAAYSFHGKLEEAGLDFVNALTLDPTNDLAIKGREYLENVKEKKATADELDRLKKEAKTKTIPSPNGTGNKNIIVPDEDGVIRIK